MELDGRRDPSGDRRAWLPNAVLAGGLALTLLITLVYASNLKSTVRHRFEADVEAARHNIQTRMEAYLTLLRGGAALFAASGDVTRSDWQSYVERLRIRELYPGMLGLGFSLRMRAEETNRVTLFMQEEGRPAFHIWPDFGRPEFHSIIFLEPADKRNATALGFDMYTDPVRREAMEAAWTNGTLAASGKVRLVQETEGPAQAGFLMYLPVYNNRQVPPTIAQRRADLYGFVYAPFRADDLINALFAKGVALNLQMSVYDGDAPLGTENLLYDSQHSPHGHRPQLQVQQSLQVADRKWTLVFSAPPSYGNNVASMFVPILPLIGAGLTLLLYYSTSAQVRARTRAETAAAALQASEELHRTISETAADAILMMDEHSIILSANRAAEQLFGYSAAELIGQPMTMLMPERMRVRHRQGVEHFLKTGERNISWNGIELPGLHKDGHEISLELSFGASRRNGRMVFTGFLRDITKRKEIEEQRDASLAREQKALNQAQALLDSLQRSESQLRLVTDALPVLISYVDRDERYRLANRAYERWFGIARADILGKTMSEVLGPAYESLRANIETALRGKEVSFETAFAYKDAKRDVRATYIPHLGAQDEVLGLFVMVADITEQKQTEAALKTAQDQLAKYAANLERKVTERTAKLTETIGELEAFSYSVSHDLRAPLRAMQGFSHVLLEDYGKKIGPEEAEYLQRIVKASERMDRLIQDVLAYSRVARSELKLQNLDLEKLIREVIQQYPALQPPRTEISIAHPLLPVVGHDASLTQCLSNLLTNAVKFVAPGVQPKIRIWTEARNGMVRVWIEDNGIGIAPQHQERIFGMFQRVHADARFEGTGIGLAIVNKAIQRMGGELGVESEAGKGSRFWFELRRGDDASAKADQGID
jgi:PAS domain S-box-containing protein